MVVCYNFFLLIFYLENNNLKIDMYILAELFHIAPTYMYIIYNIHITPNCFDDTALIVYYR